MVHKSVYSISTAILMGLSAYFGSLIYQCLQLPLVFISPRLFRWYIDLTMFMWICSSMSLIEWIIGIKFRLFGDRIIANERAIFIMNHRTRLDWLYFYGILMRFGLSLKDEKIVLKQELKRIPGAGWAMQCGSYIFLERKLEQDKQHISNLIDYFSDNNHNTKILIFPEGTDMCQYSKERSDKYADQHGLQRYQYVLHPRTAGFSHFASEMLRCCPEFDAIYDVTAAYPDKGFATNEIEFLKGKSSSEIHFYCRRYSLKEIIGCEKNHSTDLIEKENMSEKLKTFILKVWDEKEKILNEYYLDEKHRSFDNRGTEIQMDSVFIKQFISVFFMCSNVCVCLYALIIIPKVSFPFFLLLNAVYIYIDIYKNGVDQWVLKLSLKDRYRSYEKPSFKSSFSKNTVEQVIKEE